MSTSVSNVRSVDYQPQALEMPAQMDSDEVTHVEQSPNTIPPVEQTKPIECTPFSEGKRLWAASPAGKVLSLPTFAIEGVLIGLGWLAQGVQWVADGIAKLFGSGSQPSVAQGEICGPFKKTKELWNTSIFGKVLSVVVAPIEALLIGTRWVFTGKDAQ